MAAPYSEAATAPAAATIPACLPPMALLRFFSLLILFMPDFILILPFAVLACFDLCLPAAKSVPRFGVEVAGMTPMMSRSLLSRLARDLLDATAVDFSLAITHLSSFSITSLRSRAAATRSLWTSSSVSASAASVRSSM